MSFSIVTLSHQQLLTVINVIKTYTWNYNWEDLYKLNIKTLSRNKPDHPPMKKRNYKNLSTSNTDSSMCNRYVLNWRTPHPVDVGSIICAFSNAWKCPIWTEYWRVGNKYIFGYTSMQKVNIIMFFRRNYLILLICYYLSIISFHIRIIL